MATIYENNGFKSRMDYLRSLAEEYGVELRDVLMFAELYGPNEDFDGLVSSIQDIC